MPFRDLVEGERRDSASLIIRRRIETVRSDPAVIDSVRRRDLDTGLEPGERPGSVRERAQSEIGCVIDGAMADRPVAGPDVEDRRDVDKARLR